MFSSHIHLQSVSGCECQDIDTPEKAYFLGWSAGCHPSASHEHHAQTWNDVDFIDLSSTEFKWVFLRGYFDSQSGNIGVFDKTSGPNCSITARSVNLLKVIEAFVGIPCVIDVDEKRIVYQGSNAIDFLGKIYDAAGSLRQPEKYKIYCEWLGCGEGLIPECYVYKTDKAAVIPSKSKTSDAGYDLTLIKEEKKWLNNITLYDTGIKIRVNHGLYAEVVPRSSLSKSGYMLANSVGIIDNNYNGNIYVALIKVDPTAPDIQLPFRCCQLIFRQQVYVNMVETSKPFDETSRNEGGFGSTGR